jgi:uncharacterized CHY-type Zn-finger protein
VNGSLQTGCVIYWAKYKCHEALLDTNKENSVRVNTEKTLSVPSECRININNRTFLKCEKFGLLNRQ